MVYIHRYSSILRLDLFGVGFTLHSEYQAATPVKWVSIATLHEFPVRCILLLGKVCVCVCGGGGGAK